MAVPVGRWLDRHGGRAVMTCGSLLGTGLLVAWSQVRTISRLYAVLIGLGGCMAMALYEAATAVIVSWFDSEGRPRALLAMIVVAGFASTIFLPLTGLLVDHYGWRAALLVLAAIHGTISIPLHGLIVRRPPPQHATTRKSTAAGRGVVVRAALRDSRFWFLAAAFVAHSAAMSAMTVHLVGFLTHAGHPATYAATTAGLLGVLSVTGRLLSPAPTWLPFIADTRVGALVGVTAFGIGFGVASLAAPALLTTLDGYTPVLVAIGATCAVAAVGIRGKATSAPAVTGG